MSKVTFQSSILGGLPVEVTAHICPAEPDVGIFQPWVEIDEIRWLSRSRKRDRKRISGGVIPQRVLDRMTDADTSRIEEDAFDDGAY